MTPRKSRVWAGAMHPELVYQTYMWIFHVLNAY